MIRFREKLYGTTIFEDAHQGFREVTDRALLEPIDKATEYVENIEINNEKPLKKKLKRVRGIVTPVRDLIDHRRKRYNRKKGSKE